MVEIRVVRMPVHQRGMPVSGRVWLVRRIGRPVLVDVVRIVDVSVFVLEWLVFVLMLVPFCDVQ